MNSLAVSPLLSPKEASEFLRVSRNTLYRLIETGQLPASRVGSQLRIKQEDINRMLNRGKDQVAES